LLSLFSGLSRQTVTLFANTSNIMTKFLSPLLILGLSEALLKAPSVRKIDQIKQDYFEEKKKIHLCQRQLKKNKVPADCYQIRGLSEDLKQYLNKKCSEAPLESMKLHEISNLLKNQKISPQCLKVLEEKEKILKYQNHDLIIERLLKSHKL